MEPVARGEFHVEPRAPGFRKVKALRLEAFADAADPLLKLAALFLVREAGPKMINALRRRPAVAAEPEFNL